MQSESLNDTVHQSVRNCLRNGHAVALDETTPLLESGVLDSLALVELLTTLGETYAIEFDERDLDPENFATIGDIVHLVERKRLAA